MVTNPTFPSGIASKEHQLLVRESATEIDIFLKNSNSATLFTKVTIPYEFDISHAYLKGIRLQQAITLIQFEKQINIVVLKDNTFEYLGMYELAIVCFLNNNIHHVDLTKCMIDQLKLEGFVKGLQHIQAFQDEKHFLKIAKLNLMKD